MRIKLCMISAGLQIVLLLTVLPQGKSRVCWFPSILLLSSSTRRSIRSRPRFTTIVDRVDLPRLRGEYTRARILLISLFMESIRRWSRLGRKLCGTGLVSVRARVRESGNFKVTPAGYWNWQPPAGGGLKFSSTFDDTSHFKPAFFYTSYQLIRGRVQRIVGQRSTNVLRQFLPDFTYIYIYIYIYTHELLAASLWC